jgi:putative spermidine/putrescine transport system substrate-binding protein
MSAREPQSFVDKLQTIHLSRRTLVGAATAAVGASALGRGALDALAQAATPTVPPVIEPFDAGGATLRMACWGGPWGDSMRKYILDPLEKTYNCKVAYDDAWPWFPKYVAGGVNNPPFDITNWNLPEMFKTARAGDFFVPVDEVKQNLPNAGDLWDFAYQNGKGVTYLFSQLGYAYRTDKVTPAPTKFTDFWDDRFKDLRATYITTNTLQMVFFMMAAAAFGKDDKDIDAGVKAMQNAMPMKISDFTGNMQTLLQRGEAVIAVLDDAETFEPASRGIPFGFYKWTDKQPVLEQTFTVSKGAGEVQKKLAYAVISMVASRPYQEIMGSREFQRPTNKNVVIPPNLAKNGVENSADAMSKLWIPDWNWYVDNEQDIVEQVNGVFGQS